MKALNTSVWGVLRRNTAPDSQQSVGRHRLLDNEAVYAFSVFSAHILVTIEVQGLKERTQVAYSVVRRRDEALESTGTGDICSCLKPSGRNATIQRQAFAFDEDSSHGVLMPPLGLLQFFAEEYFCHVFYMAAAVQLGTAFPPVAAALPCIS
ncbi:hypothetical protein PG984_006961 [Apiospora sp. TS-2023a]